MEARMLDPSCDAAVKCWEHYQSEPRIKQIEVDEAFAQLQVEIIGSTRSMISAQMIVNAAQNYISLLGRQWREMTRKPFDFPTPHEASRRAAITSSKPTVDDLLI